MAGPCAVCSFAFSLRLAMLLDFLSMAVESECGGKGPGSADGTEGFTIREVAMRGFIAVKNLPKCGLSKGCLKKVVPMKVLIPSWAAEL